MKVALAEAAVLHSYGRTVDVDDLMVRRRNLDLTAEDDAGNKVRIIVRDRWPIRVYSRLLDVDIYVFVVMNDSEDGVIYGWLPIEQVEEAPQSWYTENGERKDYSHEINEPFLVAMPEQFKFEESCTHFQHFGGMWSYDWSGWECFGCGRILYSTAEAEHIARIDAAAGYSDQVSS